MIITAVFSNILYPVFAATACKNSFFGFPVWWKYLKQQPQPPGCEVVLDFPEEIWAIALAAVDMLLYAAGIVAVISIIIAGVGYITSQGNTEKTTSARRRIVNSLIGLAIVVIATFVVGFIGNSIG